MREPEPRIPADLLNDLRGLARRYGSLALIAACAELVKQFAVKGMQAELAERRAEEGAAEKCPRCRERAAVLDHMKQVLRRVAPPPPEGRPAAVDEE